MSSNGSNGSTASHTQASQQGYQQRSSTYYSNSSQQGTPASLQRRRDWLWQERVKLEMQVHNLLAQEQRACADAQLLAQRKAALLSQRSQVAFQIVLSGLVGMRSTPSERAYAYAVERLAQEEATIQSFWNWCQAERVRLDGQIALINAEMALLDGVTI